MERHRAEHVDDVVSRDDLPVGVVRWPAESTRRDALAKAGVPRILLVAPDAGVPEVLGVEEDWVRLPADVSDIRARADRVQQLSGHLAGARPFVDPRRVLHRGTLAVQLTPIEASIVTSLLAHAGTVVEHIDLERDVWTSTSPSREALDAAIYRLRRRLTRRRHVHHNHPRPRLRSSTSLTPQSPPAKHVGSGEPDLPCIPVSTVTEADAFGAEDRSALRPIRSA